MVCQGFQRRGMANAQGTNVVYLIVGRLLLKMVR